MPSSYLHRKDPKTANSLSVILVIILIVAILIGMLKESGFNNKKVGSSSMYLVGECKILKDSIIGRFYFNDSLFIFPLVPNDVILRVRPKCIFAKITIDSKIHFGVLYDTFPKTSQCMQGKTFERLIEGTYFVAGQ